MTGCNKFDYIFSVCVVDDLQLWGLRPISRGGIIVGKFYIDQLSRREMYICTMYGPRPLQSMNQPGKVANPARGQLNRKEGCFSVPVCA